jgi:hypothetical protein
MSWAGHVASMGERRGVYRVLVGKPERKRPHGRPRHRCDDNIKTSSRSGLGGWGEAEAGLICFRIGKGGRHS